MLKKFFILSLFIGLFSFIIPPMQSYAGEDKTPIVEITDPSDKSISYESKIYIRGKTYNTIKLLLENRPVILAADGSFSAPFTLPFYGNHYLKFIAYNKQNENSIKYLTINYVKPQDRPSITIISPENNTKTGTNTLHIRGYAGNCKQVYIDKRPVKLINKDGKTYFDEEVSLLFNGLNKIIITGHNGEDKDVTEELTVIKVASYKPGQDTKLMVYYPINNFETTQEKLSVKGRGINISKVYVNDELIKLDKDSNYQAEIMLQYGSNTIEVVGIGPNDVSIKETRTVLRLNNEMEKQKNQVIKVETHDRNRKLTSFDYVVTEKDRIEEKLNRSIQKIIDGTVGPNKVILSLVINLNTQKIKNELDTEFEGDINKFIQNIDSNLVVDAAQKKQEQRIRNLINQNLSNFKNIRQTYDFKYISFSEHSESPIRMPEIKVTTKLQEDSKPLRKESTESSIINQVGIKQQTIENTLRNFYQQYIDHVVGNDHAIIDFNLILNKDMLKNALNNHQEDQVITDFDKYVVTVKAIILFDNSNNKLFEDKIKTLLRNSIKRFGDFSLKTEFIYDKFEQKHSSFNPGNLPEKDSYIKYFIIMIALFGTFILLLIIAAGAVLYYLRDKLQPESINSKGDTNTGDGKMRLSDLPTLMNKSEKINVSHISSTAEKTFFSFIDENNVHKLKLVLGLQIVQDEASVETIAIIVSYLSPALAAKVIMMYPPKIQAQIMDMLAEPSQYASEQILKLEKEIKNSMDGIVGGNTHLLQVMDNLSQKTAKNIFDELEKKYPSTFNNLKPSVVIFEDILLLADKDLETLLKEVDPKNIANAIVNATQEDKDKVYSLLSINGKEMVQEWVELKGNKIKEIEIEESRKFIISIALILESMNEIKIQRGKIRP